MSRSESLESLLAADREARDIAQREFENPVVLEAGAGTGKTTTLVARVLSWALGPGWQAAAREIAEREQGEAPGPEQISPLVLEGIVSITFTEAAAAEMETRIAQGLAQVAAGRGDEIVGFLGPPDCSPEEAAARSQALLAGLDHLTVRTIHAYCLNLLKRYPLEAGLHPDLVVDADGTIVEELVREVVEHGLREAYVGTAEGHLIHLARRKIGPRRIADALRLLVERGFASEHLRQDPFAAERTADLIDRLRRPLRALLEIVDERFAGLPASQNAPKVVAAATATAQALTEAEERFGASLEAAIHVCTASHRLWTDRLVENHLGKWKRGSFSKAEGAALEDRAEALQPVALELRSTLRHFRRLDPPLLDHGRRALVGLLARVETEMRARGVITFSGLLQSTRDLLADHRSVRHRERGRLRQLLVDEFQDTDRLQCDLVRLLALDGPVDRRPGLFVVGDPKQSIYGWRNADLEAYEAFVSSAIEAGGRRFPLVENFRSAGPVLAEVDRAIAPTMVQRAGLQPAYEPLIACERLAESPGFERAERRAVEHWVSWRRPDGDGGGGERTTHDDAARLEAEAVAHDIAELHDRGDTGWGDCAVLLRSGSRLDLFLTAFRDAGVPFAVARDKSYFRRREVIEAAALVRAVVNPVDHLALLTFLRSASVGVPDAALIPLWARQFPDLMSDLSGLTKETRKRLREVISGAAAEVSPDIPGIADIRGWEKSLLSGSETLLRLRGSFHDDPPDRFIEHIRSWLLLEATESARYLGSFRVANLERFLRQLEGSLERSGGDIQTVLRALRRSVGEAREAEEAVPKEAALDAVQILTIHAAKGLEFKHVYLAQLHARSPDGDEQEIDTDERWAPGEPLEYRIFGCSTPDFDRVTERRRQVETAERVRLLYVAMTRARERLVLLGKWPAAPVPPNEDQRRAFIDLLSCREPLPSSIADLTPTEDSTQRGLETAEALWWFPGYTLPERPQRQLMKAPSWLPSLEAARSSDEHLSDLAQAAAARMERPFHEPATREAGERLQALALESGERGTSGAASRDVAMLVGTAIHRLFETFDLEAEVKVEFARQRRSVEAFLETSVAVELHDEALARARALLDRIEHGRLFQRFLELRPDIVARELSVALSPRADDTGPVGFLSGAIDLVYRRPSGELAIVDFKTDTVELEVEIEARAAAYLSQERIYQEAVHSALDLEDFPSCELWFLWPDALHTAAS